MELDQNLNDLVTQINLETSMGDLETHFAALDSVVVQTALQLEQVKAQEKTGFEPSASAKALVARRRVLRNLEATDQVAKTERVEISKLIQKTLRREMRTHRNKQISAKLNAFRDLKSIAGIRSNR